MKQIPQEIITKIREQSDIVDVISQYLHVERKGKSYVCLCPFHDDKSPSLMISKEKQIYRCFACGASGSVFSFVENYEKISFPQAVAKLGNQLGFNIQLGKVEVKVDPNKKPFYEILQSTIEYTQFQLLVNTLASDYVKNRMIDQRQIEKFQIGYDDGNLEQFLKTKGYDYTLMEEAYLIHNNVYGSVDVFKERVVFPIHDLNGNPVGFTGRTLTNAAAKYINTAETKVYVKGNLLYNYHRVKQSETKKSHVYLVEGTMDVIAFDRAGIYDCVAMLGTAITPEQIQALKRLNTKIYVCLDGDDAGKNATYKFGILASEHQLPFEIVDWHSEKDPDEFLTTAGHQTFLKTIQSTISWIQFLMKYLKTKYNLENYTEKKQFGELIAKYIYQIKDEVEKKSYFKILQEMTSFDYSNQTTPQPTIYIPETKVRVKSNIERAQLEILNQIILSKRACDIFTNTLGMLIDENYNAIAIEVIRLYYEKVKIELGELLERLDASQANLIASLQEDELFVKQFDEEIVKSNICLIKMDILIKQQNLLKNKILSETDLNKKQDYIQDSIELTKTIQQLKIKGGD